MAREKVYVADCSNHRIQVFTAEGKFLHMLGRHGQGRGELDCPVCIAIDTSGMVYVSELGSNRVSVFTSESQFVTSFGRMGKGQGQFERPFGLAVDNSGVVYVCDRVFSYFSTPPLIHVCLVSNYFVRHP